MHTRASFLKLLGGAGLAAGMTGCSSPGSTRHLSLATGPKEGLWETFGWALSKQWRARAIAGSIDVRTGTPTGNSHSLLAGEVDLAIDAADSALEAIHQRGSGLLALGRIYDDYIQTVVPADSPIQQISDLRGKRVWVNIPGLALLPSTANVLDAADLNGHIVAVNLPVPKAFDALVGGSLDAMLFNAGLPTPGIVSANRRRPMRLLDQSSILSQLRRQNSVYGAATIPSSVYSMPGAAATSATLPNYLLTTARMPNEIVAALLDSMFSNRAALMRDVQVAGSLDQNAAIATAPIPLHPGAINYYRSARP